MTNLLLSAKYAVLISLLLVGYFGIGFIVSLFWVGSITRFVNWYKERGQSDGHQRVNKEKAEKIGLRFPKGVLEKCEIVVEELEELTRENEQLRAKVDKLKRKAHEQIEGEKADHLSGSWHGQEANC